MSNDISRIMKAAQKLYFIGVGGISMSSLALACKRHGYDVSGSDRASSPITEKLKKEGITVYGEHRAENISGADAVVYSGAIADDNPEMVAAKENGIPTIYRADLLGYIMRSYERRIGVSGMHGKSTVTSMISHVFISCGLDPTVMSGAETKEMGGACRFGKGEDFIFEACEYKDSFLDMFPTIAVILNIDVDHTDYFSGIEQIKESFDKFAHIPFSSDAKTPAVVACGDDANAYAIASDLPYPVTFGIKNEKCDYIAKNISDDKGYYSFDVYTSSGSCGKVKLHIPGYHNIYNALATFAVCDLCDIPHEKICSAISDFEGTLRRFEYKGKCEGASVYIDYAHHPTELEAAISTARDIAKGKKVVAVFEPHTYSRTKDHFDEFAEVLSKADTAILVDIYAAREKNESGVSSEQLADKIPGAWYAPSYDSAAAMARGMAEDGGVILVLGAGTVYKIADILA